MEGPTPYRAGKPLAEIIPPDCRRAKMVALVVSSMIAGISLWVLGGYALEAMRSEETIPPPTPGYPAGTIRRGVLHGPGGDVSMPPASRSVVHVWLQGCQDCMPAFEAMQRLESEGGLGVTVPIINVAYGEADASWAARYGVRTGLVFDVGGTTVVRPLGIGTFTTLVVDPNGVILHRDRPNRPGYRDRIREAVGAANVVAQHEERVPEPLDSAAVERVVSAHRSSIRRRCWESRGSERVSANVTLRLNIGPNGDVLESSTSSDDPLIAKCIETDARSWAFPSAPGRAPMDVNIPFKFLRQ